MLAGPDDQLASEPFSAPVHGTCGLKVLHVDLCGVHGKPATLELSSITPQLAKHRHESQFIDSSIVDVRIVVWNASQPQSNTATLWQGSFNLVDLPVANPHTSDVKLVLLNPRPGQVVDMTEMSSLLTVEVDMTQVPALGGVQVFMFFDTVPLPLHPLRADESRVIYVVLTKEVLLTVSGVELRDDRDTILTVCAVNRNDTHEGLIGSILEELKGLPVNMTHQERFSLVKACLAMVSASFQVQLNDARGHKEQSMGQTPEMGPEFTLVLTEE